MEVEQTEVEQTEVEQTEDNKTVFRELYYSSLLRQLQVNETNKIKIALISVGATIASIIATTQGIQSLSIPFLSLAILILVYIPWFYTLYYLFKKLRVDDKVINEKIERVGTKKEKQDPPSKGLADKLDKYFHWSLNATLIGILIIVTYIFTFTPIIGIIGKETNEMNKKKTTQDTATHTVVDKKPTEEIVDDQQTHQKQQGGKLPGFFDADQGNTDQGNTDQGNTDQGNTDQGNTDQGNTDQGNTDQGNTDQDEK